MEEPFWERKGVKLAFFWIAIDVLVVTLLYINGFDWEFIKSNWVLIIIAVINIDRIVIPLANLPEPPPLFTFLVGIIPVGVLIAFYVALRGADSEAQIKTAVILFITLLFWNAANIGWGIFEKKKQNKKIGL
ncbi:MAG: hypothetical protein E7482_06965 [Ruminococcaceae bacterium]|nr:hypothetical protein [Oscillospiraceae bacterium]